MIAHYPPLLQRLTIPFLVWLLVACSPPGGTPSTPTLPASTATTTAPAPPTSTPPAPADATVTPSPTPESTAPTAPWTHENIFHTLLGAAPAPPGWEVTPCPGQGGFLCVSEGETAIGPVELQIWPLDSYPDFQEILDDVGVTPGELPAPDQATAALSALAERYLDTIQEDRALTYPEDEFIRIGPEPVQMGDLPGVAVSFRREGDAGQIEERYLNYVTFDGRILYWLGAPFDPLNVTTFTSDEALLQFEPYLGEIVADLELPPPIAETSVSEVTVSAADVYLTTLYGEATLEEASQTEAYAVTGASPDGQWWQVDCPQFLTAHCWLPNDPARVRPQGE